MTMVNSPKPPRGRQEPLIADTSGDYVFRFKLDMPRATVPEISLSEVYRRELLDLLAVVQLFSGDEKPVIVDKFAFHHKPSDLIQLDHPHGDDNGHYP